MIEEQVRAAHTFLDSAERAFFAGDLFAAEFLYYAADQTWLTILRQIGKFSDLEADHIEPLVTRLEARLTQVGNLVGRLAGTGGKPSGLTN